MISFACKLFKFSQIIRCSFELTKGEYALLMNLLDSSKQLTVKELSSLAEVDRSTAQKALAGLMKKDLVLRRQINQSLGGYVYLYRPLKKTEVKKRISIIIADWYKHVKKDIQAW